MSCPVMAEGCGERTLSIRHCGNTGLCIAKPCKCGHEVAMWKTRKQAKACAVGLGTRLIGNAKKDMSSK